MRPQSYIESVVDRNFVMRHIPVCKEITMHGNVLLWLEVNCNLLWISMTERRNFLTTQSTLLVVQAVISCHRLLKETQITTHNDFLLFFKS